ncbi:MAG TPA: phospholipid carrier-dependent glycosyltransferase, partial [Polyangiaceae bacterium]|nr:phospholipid carrier-dependent glycosyltransferase [Polyangiaceae bacterium]
MLSGGARARLGRRTKNIFSSLRRSIRRDGPLFLLCAALVALGTWLRAVDLGFPPSLTWDEHHFVLNARNYITHQHDWNDHPPLGKLLIVPWLLLLGDSSRSFRMNSFVFGLLAIV